MSELNVNAIKKLKVAELRAELTRRGLDSKGNKPVLVERLIEAVGSGEEEMKEQSTEENTQEMAADSSQNDNEDMQHDIDEVEKDEGPAQGDESAHKDEGESKAQEAEERLPTPNEEAEVKSEPEKSQEASRSEVEENAAQEVQAVEKTDKTEDEAESKQNEEEEDEEEREDEKAAEESVEPEEEEEEEVELDESLVVMDRFNCDIYLKVTPDGLSCRPLPEDCFTYLFAGGKATWGVTSGKVCFECKVSSFLSVELEDIEEPKQAVRVGWSVGSIAMQLGEDKLSYGYDSTGKKCGSNDFSDYGQSFGEGDVITCYLDLESEEKTISFCKNGEELGTAFTLSNDDVQGKALFPHVLVKNVECSLNFGAAETPWFAPKEGFTFMQQLPEDARVRGLKGPAAKAECEVIMMIGLPASGKTHWVKAHVEANPDKNYYILGTNNIMDKMKVMGVARKRETGGYTKLMDKAAKCLQRLFELAPRKKRNYILDQTNVYLSAQRKKMMPFKGFQRKAMVCVPENDVLRRRTEERRREGITLPENAVNDMKASFALPKTGEYLEEIIFCDQSEKTSESIVEGYHREGRSFHSRSMREDPPYKRQRTDDRPSRWSSHDSRGGRHSGGGSGGSSWSSRDRRHDHRGSGGYRAGRGYQGGGGNRGGYGGGYRQQQNMYGSRGGYNDRRQGGSGGSSSSHYGRDQRSPRGNYRSQQQQRQQPHHQQQQRQGGYSSRSYGQQQQQQPQSSYGHQQMQPQQQYGGYGSQPGYGGYQSFGGQGYQATQQGFMQQSYGAQQQQQPQYSNYYQGYSGSGY